MDVHIRNLAKLCRVCGEKIVIKRGYATAKNVENHKNVLLACYHINIESESVDVYPKLLCNGCHRKLLRLSNSTITESEAAINSFTFIHHCESSCKICTVPVISDIKIKDLDKVFQSIGFNKIAVLEAPANLKRIYSRQSIGSHGALVNDTIFKVFHNDTWECHVHGNKVTMLTNIIGETLSNDSVYKLESFFEDNVLCKGISSYEDVILDRIDIKQPFDSKSFEKSPSVEDDNHHSLKQAANYKIARSEDCLFFHALNKKFCLSCQGFVKKLTVHRGRINVGIKHDSTEGTSHTNFRYMTHDDKNKKLANLQADKRSLARRLVFWSSKINDEVSKNGVTLDDNHQKAFGNMMNLTQTQPPFSEDTPQFLLWEQQKLQAMKKDSKGMRWHPLIIRWCLSIYFTSSAAYKQMSNKNLNFLRLPSVDTLRQYGHFTKPQTGFNPEIIEQLMVNAKVDELDEKGRQVIIAFDEMQIKSKLVYQKGTGKLIGFTELGSVNDEFKSFQSSFTDDSVEIARDFSTHVLMYMVRGIFSSLIYPFGYFATTGATASQLYPCTLEAVKVLTSIDFVVRAIVSDGASPNRKFYDAIASDKQQKFWTWNPHHSSLQLYFFSDVPHLLKTTRNCLENSKWNKNTRNLHLDHQDVTWKHIVDLYEEDVGLVAGKKFELRTNAPGLRKLPRLTEEHIKLTSRSRMTVKLAAQVLSQSTVQALIHQNKHDTKSTIKFIDIFDKVFDCLNVSNLSNSRKSKKEIKEYRSPDDWRFKFLKEEFLDDFLGKWEKQVESLKNLSKDEQSRMLLSIQTRNGWKMTVSSFVSLAQELLKIDGVKFLLSEKFSQDPLEEHFGRQRRRGGSNDNPTLAEFGQQENVLNVMKSELMQDIKGNTRGKNRGKASKIDVHDTRQLPKRRKQK